MQKTQLAVTGCVSSLFSIYLSYDEFIRLAIRTLPFACTSRHAIDQQTPQEDKQQGDRQCDQHGCRREQRKVTVLGGVDEIP